MLRIASRPQVADLKGRFGTPLAVALTIVLLPVVAWAARTRVDRHSPRQPAAA